MSDIMQVGRPLDPWALYILYQGSAAKSEVPYKCKKPSMLLWEMRQADACLC